MKWNEYEISSSDEYSELVCNESDSIYLHRGFLEEVMYYADGMERIYVKLINMINNKEILCSIGGSHHIPKRKNLIIVPKWISEELNVIDGLECFNVELYPNTIFKGDAISIRPLDPIIYNMDTLDILQRGMDKYTVLQEDTTIDIVIPELDNYPIKIHIEKLHMDRKYMLLGGELEIHLIGREEIMESEKEYVHNIPMNDNINSNTIVSVSDMPFGIDVPLKTNTWAGVGRVLKENCSHEVGVLDKEEVRQKRLARFATQNSNGSGNQ